MMQSVYDNFKILIANIRYTFQTETAYRAGSLASVFSTTFYTLTYLGFIGIIYSNVDTVAGYTQNEMNLFFLFSQLTAYTFFIINDNVAKLIESVNTGNLDLILTKPVSSLFYTSFSRIRIFSMTRDMLPPLIAILLIINWSSLNLSVTNSLSALLVLIIGMLIGQAFLQLCALPVFWVGESTQLFNVTQEVWFSSGSTVPYEGVPSFLKFIFTFLIPGIIPSALATSVALGKTDALFAIVLSFLILILFFILRSYLWKIALKNYTSASS